jgi:hypothetical protein
MKTHGIGRGRAPIVLKSGTGWRWMVDFTYSSLHLRRNSARFEKDKTAVEFQVRSGCCWRIETTLVSATTRSTDRPARCLVTVQRKENTRKITAEKEKERKKEMNNGERNKNFSLFNTLNARIKSHPPFASTGWEPASLSTLAG